MKKSIVTTIVIMSVLRSFAAGGQGMLGFLWALANSDVVGFGVYEGEGGGGNSMYDDRVSDVTYWIGDPGTNSVSLFPFPGSDGPVFPQDVETNDVVVFLELAFPGIRCLQMLCFERLHFLHGSGARS